MSQVPSVWAWCEVMWLCHRYPQCGRGVRSCGCVTGTLSVEAIYQDRDQFASLVREMASPDVGRMGIEILSFTIKDVYDNVEYLASLGRTQTANVKRDADVGVVEANRDAGIRVSGVVWLSGGHTGASGGRIRV